MAKNKTEIHVTTVFDGELDATDVFVSLISQKYGRTNTKEYLAKKKVLKYNEDEVQKIILYRSSQELSVPEFQWCHSCVPSKILTKE